MGELLGALDGLCARLNQGWWTYEWCHRQEIHQYHQDTVNGPRSPNWSLGGYSPKTSNDGDHPAALDRAVDIFDVGGQRCDETNRGRMSRVTFGCCEDGGPSRARASKRSRKMSTSPSGPRGAYLVSVEETALCEYALSVCAPSLCTSQSSNVTASRLLSTMEGSCLRRPEGWWEFEFCYKKHVRQYHVEDRKYVADFSLGKFQGKEEDLVVIAEDGDEPRVEIEYEGGTECDTTTNAKRATTIKLICGDTPAFLNVVEDRTCHYVFTVQTPALCKHPEFANFFNPNARPVQCDEVSDE